MSYLAVFCESAKREDTFGQLCLSSILCIYLIMAHKLLSCVFMPAQICRRDREHDAATGLMDVCVRCELGMR